MDDFCCFSPSDILLRMYGHVTDAHPVTDPFVLRSGQQLALCRKVS